MAHNQIVRSQVLLILVASSEKDKNSPFILRRFDDDVYEPLPANNSCLLMGISSL